MHVTDEHPKVVWLREHPDLWQSWPDGVPPCTKMPRRCHDDEPDVHHIKARWRLIVAGMKRDGLISPHTWAGDVHICGPIMRLRGTTAPTPCDLCTKHKHCFVRHVHGVRSRREGTRAVRATTTPPRHRLGTDPHRLEHTMSNAPKTHEDRIAALEALGLALADDMLAVVQKTRQVAGHT